MVAGNFLQPIGRFVQFADTLQVLEADLQRIEDIMATPEDPALVAHGDAENGKLATLEGRLHLAGRIELRNVTFGYHRNRPPSCRELQPHHRTRPAGRAGRPHWVGEVDASKAGQW